MRGTDQQQAHVFSYLSPEQRVRKDHPLRPIRMMVDEILKQLSPQFNKMYAKVGRPSIPPEQLLRAQLLQMLYSVRSERLLMEEMDYNILFRWFVGLNLDDPVWDATVFTKNRDRLLEAEVAKEFLSRVVAQARERGWTSDEHFSVGQREEFSTQRQEQFATAGHFTVGVGTRISKERPFCVVLRSTVNDNIQAGDRTLWAVGPSPDKRDSRHVGIPRIPDDDKRTYQDLGSCMNMIGLRSEGALAIKLGQVLGLSRE